ncbi:protein-N(pi)-phosphohistidine--sugar phosphotransferase [Lactobacillus selangorensis]|uniref:Protein-N(Pi)-phosphohistidine--sugar phosphotransferase n=2 Tax=Lactobacillus selangorensis TaxID=81857 RepID=A0A0R2FPY4_9LACO|nr:protein-N(pi)-phosphohistidine--sugar phosphotransferase [Lactobacillus selangorensis]KRN30578.1 protein-N(pi)-phosphohistidine--sugar phosphotransferase [Lactobacillus selangorensis]
MTIKYARIDSRLLHAQVANAVVKAVQPNRIIVASDGVAKDTLRKELMVQAAPEGLKVNVMPLDKLIEAYKDPHFDDLEVLLLTETPEDMVTLVKGGIKLTQVDVGGMSFSNGKVMVADSLAADADDAKALRWLADQGIDVYYQTVPAEQKQPVEKLLEAKGL